MLTGCYYYDWYSGDWLVQTQRRMDHPALGQYNNTHYGDVVLDHLRQMRRADVDFISVSWDPQQTNYDHVLDACEDTGMKMTVLYESLSHSEGKNKRIKKEALEAILYDMEDLAENLQDPGWLKIGGKPVVMLYVTRNYKDADEIFPAIRETLGDVYLVGDEIFWGKGSDPEKLKHFDAVTSYNWYQPGRFEGKTKRDICDSFLANVRECVEKNLETCAEAGVPYWPVAMPGYDDRRVRPEVRHAPIPRLEGYLFGRSIKDAMDQAPECMMVTSWNEFYEDTQIEPCRSYETMYLDILKASLR